MTFAQSLYFNRTKMTFLILIALLMTPSMTSGQDADATAAEQWNDHIPDGRSADLDSLVKYIYTSSNGEWDNAATLNLTEIQNSIHEKLSKLNLTSTDLDSLLDFDNVALTPLGQLTAWLGDRIYPFVIYGIILVGVITVFVLFSQVHILHTFALGTCWLFYVTSQYCGHFMGLHQCGPIREICFFEKG